jgi:ABC-type transporter Mla subunit MlaD
MANVAVMIANLNKTLTRVDRFIVTQGPQIEQALANLRAVSADLKELAGDLKQHPSQLILSQPPSKSEVSNE